MNETKVGFFPRRAEVEYLKKWALSLREGYRQNVCITGNYLCGKTTLIQQFLKELAHERLVFVYIESPGLDIKTFVTKFTGGLLYSLLELYRPDDARARSLSAFNAGELLSLLEPHAPLVVRAIKDINAPGRKAEDMLSAALDVCACLYQETGLVSILIFDEFHALANLHHNMFKILSKRIMLQRHTMFIFLSSRVHIARDILKSKFDLLFGNFHQIEVENFDFVTAKNFLKNTLPHAAFESSLDHFLLAITNGNPFYLTAVTERLKSSLERFRLVVTRDDMAHALQGVLFEPHGALNQHFQKTIQELSRQPQWAIVEHVLGCLARGDLKLEGMSAGKKKFNRLVSRSLEYLIKEDIIFKCGTLYDFADCAFKFWYTHVHAIRNESLVSNPHDQEQRFSAAARAAMDKFCEESTKDIYQRTLEFFQDFQLHLVHLRGRAYKIPRFAKVVLKDIGSLQSCVLAQNKRRYWVGIVKRDYVTEEEVHNVAEALKKYRKKLSRKVLITLNDMDQEALTIAKQNNFTVINLNDFNTLLRLCGKEILIP